MVYVFIFILFFYATLSIYLMATLEAKVISFFNVAIGIVGFVFIFMNIIPFTFAQKLFLLFLVSFIFGSGCASLIPDKKNS